MAVSAALALPEIIGNIFAYLGSTSDLSHCTVVNRQWRECAMSLLWETSPSLLHLCKMRAHASTFEYLKFVKQQKLVIHETSDVDDFRDAFESGILIQCPLVKLHVVMPAHGNEFDLVGFSLHSLRILVIEYAHFKEDLLDVLEVSRGIVTLYVVSQMHPRLQLST